MNLEQIKLLKDSIIEKHFYVARRFITESFQANVLKDPLKLSLRA